MFRFAAPELLWLLALLPIVAAAPFVLQRPTLRWSSLALLHGGSSWRTRLRWLPGFLRIIALALLIIAAARPQWGTGKVRSTVEGVALMTVIDRSYSMASKMEFAGRPMTRLEAVKRVFTEFLLGQNPADAEEGQTADQAQNLIGLVTFAAFPETVAPPSRIYDPLIEMVSDLELVGQHSAQNRTAIGDALMLAAARLDYIEEELRQRQPQADDDAAADAAAPPAAQDFEIKSKAIILLTDGDENFGDIGMLQAAEVAAELGIRIYAIGIGGYQVIELGGQQLMVRGGAGGYDESKLRAVAEKTGGLFRAATDGEALRAIYAEIDALETTEIQAVSYTNYAERFIVPTAPAAGLLALELLLSATLLRRLP